MPDTGRISATEAIVRQVSGAGLRRVYTVPGDLAYRLIAAFEAAGIPVISCRTQTSAVFAAAAENVATGRLAALTLVTRGPAFANGLAAVSSVIDHGTPFLLLSPGDLDEETRRTAFQGGIPLRLSDARPCHWCEVHDPETLQPALGSAFAAAQQGAAVVTVDREVLGQTVPVSGAGHAGAVERGPDAGTISRAVELLRAAKNPVIVAGHRARWSATTEAIAEAARRLAAPVCTSGLAVSFGGAALPTVPMEQAYATLARADVVLTLGAPCDWTMRHGAGISPEAQVIDLPGLQKEVGFTRSGGLCIAGPIGAALDTLFAQLPERAAREDAPTAERRKPAASLFARIIASLAEAFPPATALVVDGSTALIDTTRRIVPGPDWARFTPGRSGHLGSGPGHAIGAAASGRFDQIVFVTGDLSLGLSLSDLETMVRYDLPVRVLVDNNGGIRAGASQSLKLTPRVTGHVPTDYAAIMRAVGGVGITVTTGDEWQGARTALFSATGPGMIDVRG